MINEILNEKQTEQLANTIEARMSLTGEEIIAVIPFENGDRVLHILKSGCSFEVDFLTLGFVIRNPKVTKNVLIEMNENLKPIKDTAEIIEESIKEIDDKIGDKQGDKQRNQGGSENETTIV